MANAVYTKGLQHFLQGDIDWDAHNIKAFAYDHAVDAPVPATDEFVSDLSGTKSTNRTAAFSSKTQTGGVADAADTTITALDNAISFESIQIYDESGGGSDAARQLLVSIDTATGLPVTGNGGDLNIAWANTGLDGAGGIFKL